MLFEELGSWLKNFWRRKTTCICNGARTFCKVSTACCNAISVAAHRSQVCPCKLSSRCQTIDRVCIRCSQLCKPGFMQHCAAPHFLSYSSLGYAYFQNSPEAKSGYNTFFPYIGAFIFVSFISKKSHLFPKLTQITQADIHIVIRTITERIVMVAMDDGCW